MQVFFWTFFMIFPQLGDPGEFSTSVQNSPVNRPNTIMVFSRTVLLYRVGRKTEQTVVDCLALYVINTEQRWRFS